MIVFRNGNSVKDFEKRMVPKGDRLVGDRLGVWDWHMHTEVYGMTGQWGPATEPREPHPLFCHHLCGNRV